MDKRERNIEIFQDTKELVESSKVLTAAVADTRKKQKLILSEDAVTGHIADLGKKARIIVSEKRTLQAAGAYKGKKVCILNFASATNPGGGVVHGSSAQEESICRCSTLYFCLDTPELMRTFYLPHRRMDNPLYNDDLIYSPDVYVVKTDTASPERISEKEWYPVNVITCAAPNLRERPSNLMNPGGGSKPARITDKDLHTLLTERIRRIFRVAAAEGNEVLILGAFGCGAFRNPPRIVSNVFRQTTMDFRKNFETIEYAVYHTGRDAENYEAFRASFQGMA